MNDYTWEEISDISASGQAANYFSVGDTKLIILNGKYGFNNNDSFLQFAIDAFIVGINHNAELEEDNLIHFQIGKIDDKPVALVDSLYNGNTSAVNSFCMNVTQSNTGGWASSHMRTTVMGEDNSHTPLNPKEYSIMFCLPADLRAVMKPCIKYTDNVGNGSGQNIANISATTEYLCLPSETEIAGSTQFSNSYEEDYQQQYTYYSLGNPFNFFKYNQVNSPVHWWLRSPRKDTNTEFVRVYTSGKMNVDNAIYKLGISPLFFV